VVRHTADVAQDRISLGSGFRLQRSYVSKFAFAGSMTLEQRLDQTCSDLLSHLPAIREGNTEAVHDARVAARRMRAYLALLDDGSAEAWKQTATAVKRAGRALGKVRDNDVALSLLAELEQRSPDVAAAAATHRARLLRVQAAAQRKLIKRLEKTLSSSSFARDLSLSRHRHSQTWPRSRQRAGRLVDVLSERAGEARRRMDHATGVYFANRAHNLRGALRRLRYVLELADESDGRRRALKVLRRAQETLGRAHDRQMLLDSVVRAEQRDEALKRSGAGLPAVLEAECRSLYQTYLSARPEIADVCDSILRWSAARRGIRRSRMLKMGALALPPALLLVPRLIRRVPA
jgi:CHAD domain-containing protein